MTSILSTYDWAIAVARPPGPLQTIATSRRGMQRLAALAITEPKNSEQDSRTAPWGGRGALHDMIRLASCHLSRGWREIQLRRLGTANVRSTDFKAKRVLGYILCSVEVYVHSNTSKRGHWRGLDQQIARCTQGHLIPLALNV